MADFGEPWRGQYYETNREGWFTANRDGRAVFQMRDGPFPDFPPFTRLTDEQQEVTRRRIQDVINALAGVPTDALTRPSPALSMFLAFLKGDQTAALAFADKVAEDVQRGPGYASREDLLGLLGSCRDCLRVIQDRNRGVPPKLLAELDAVLGK